MPFVSRAEWGARTPKSTGNSISSHPKGVAVHYEGPKMGTRDHSKCAALVRSIQDFHMDTRGWVDIAYTMCVCEHGYVYEGRGIGKGSAANGTTAANLAYYAVCGLVGKGDPVPARLADGIRDAIDICRRNGAGNDVVGHRDLFSTECPGDVLYAFVRAGAPRSQTVGGGGKSVHVPAAPATKPVKAVKGKLAVDGDLGPNTIRAMQRWVGATPDGDLGPKTIRALQTKVGSYADGKLGKNTIRALQIKVGAKRDGAATFNTQTVRALQSYLNRP